MKTKEFKKNISITNQMGLKKENLFWALLSGLLLFLSFPKFGLGFIAWIAFVPLLIALRNTEKIGSAFILGWTTGFSASVGIIYWVTYVVVNYGHLPIYLGIAIMLLLACYLGLYYALFAAGIIYLRKKIPLFLFAPVLWVCLEYIKSKLFTGFPWENLGYSQYSNILFIQFADVVGIFGLSFLILILNVCIYKIVVEKTKQAFALAAVVVLIWAGVYLYGILRIRQIDQAMKNAPVMSVSLIQGNIDQSIKWNDNFKKDTIRIYEELSLLNTEDDEGLVVWPETAVPFTFQDESILQQRVKTLPGKTKSWYILGSVSYSPRKDGTDYFNSAYLLSPQGEIHGKYDKVHLVPYGEYVPLKNIFPFISRLAAGIGDFAEGNGFYPLTMGKRKVGVMICYEGILPEAGRSYKASGAELLVNITNDAWFGMTSAPYQHFSMSIFRAIESRLYLVRAANTGISAIVDPTGRIVKQTQIFQKDKIHDNVKFIKLPTIYDAYGDWIVFASFIGLIVFVLLRIKGRKSYVS